VTQLASKASAAFVAQGMPAAAADKLAHTLTQAPSEVFPQLAQQPNGAALLQSAGTAFAEATKFVGIAAASFVFLGLIATLFLPKSSGLPTDEALKQEPGTGVEATA
jgi:hypothetical protein